MELKADRVLLLQTQHGSIALQLPTSRIDSEPEGGSNITQAKPATKEKLAVTEKGYVSKKSAPSKSVVSDEDEDLFVRDRYSNGHVQTGNEESTDTIIADNGSKYETIKSKLEDNVMVDDNSEVSGEVYACANPGCVFTHESEEKVLQHKAVSQIFLYIISWGRQSF